MYPVQKPDNQPWRFLSVVFLFMAFAWTAFCVGVITNDLKKETVATWSRIEITYYVVLWGVPVAAFACLSSASRPND